MSSGPGSLPEVLVLEILPKQRFRHPREVLELTGGELRDPEGRHPLESHHSHLLLQSISFCMPDSHRFLSREVDHRVVAALEEMLSHVVEDSSVRILLVQEFSWEGLLLAR